MTENQIEWSRKRDELVSAIKQLGFPRELGEQIAKQLGTTVANIAAKNNIKNVNVIHVGQQLAY